LEALKRDFEKTQRLVLALRKASDGIEAAIGPPPLRPEGIPESRRFLRGNGQPIKPKKAIEQLLRAHQGEMPTQ
jgi:hypothetical protein